MTYSVLLPIGSSTRILDVTWPFVKGGLNNIISDLKRTLQNRDDRPTIEEDIARIEEFIKRQEDRYSRA